MTVHNVKACPSIGYGVSLYGINCYITHNNANAVNFQYIYLIGMKVFNVTAVMLHLIRDGKNINADFSFMIIY
jgi:hypothetical protein